MAGTLITLTSAEDLDSRETCVLCSQISGTPSTRCKVCCRSCPEAGLVKAAITSSGAPTISADGE
jgi:hypothetical protein